MVEVADVGRSEEEEAAAEGVMCSLDAGHFRSDMELEVVLEMKSVIVVAVVKSGQLLAAAGPGEE